MNIFVGNRVGKIQSLTSKDDWYHVTTSCNPADLISRGMQPDQLKNSLLWWKGPAWLSSPKDAWPISKTDLPDELPETKQTKFFIARHDEIFLLTRYSSLPKLKRVTAYCLRFIHNCKQRISDNRKTGVLSVSEIKTALQTLIKLSQSYTFAEEINLLQKQGQLLPKHKLSNLTPFIDSQDILRVGGRIQNSNLHFNQKHPIIMSSQCNLSKMICIYEHLRHYHAGPQHLLYITREQFWIIGGRSLTKKITRECITCFRARPKGFVPIMANLFASRTVQNHPFIRTGTDFAGPFLVRERRGRGQKSFKCYVCVFVCMCTKALHLEVLTDLKTESFMQALRRLISRRGQPTHMFSDNGKTFVKASSELRELGQFLQANQIELIEKSQNHYINWQFIPAYSPNFGGLWEAGVKSMKGHLKRVLSNALVTLEEFITIITEIEGILNSRPISPLSDNPNDYLPLTPGHFLIGRPITSIPEPDLTESPTNRLNNYQRILQLKQHFWVRWHKEYISELQLHYKWKQNIDNVKINSMVLIKETNSPPMCWKLGRIVDIHPDKTGVIRVVSIKTPTSVVKRATSQVCVLPLNS